MTVHAFRKVTLAVGAACLVSYAPPAATGQDWRGMGRIQGSVVDAEGHPIPGASLAARNTERGGGMTIKSDAKGRWVLGGVSAGTWELDIEAEGYQAKKISVNLPAEAARLAPITVPLEKAAPRGGGSGLGAAAARAEEAYKAERWAEARQEYEKLLAQQPGLAGVVEQQIGFTYIKEKNFAAAVEHLDKALAADPSNQKARAIAAQAAFEGGMVDKARALLAELDESAITSPDVFFNMGVNFFNHGDADEAIGYFGKAIRIDPSYVDAYYRRALAYLGQQKTAAARADFLKVIELQPDSEMGTMSRKALEQLK